MRPITTPVVMPHVTEDNHVLSSPGIPICPGYVRDNENEQCEQGDKGQSGIHRGGVQFSVIKLSAVRGGMSGGAVYMVQCF